MSDTFPNGATRLEPQKSSDNLRLESPRNRNENRQLELEVRKLCGKLRKKDYKFIVKSYRQSCLTVSKCIDQDLPCLLKLGLSNRRVFLLYDFGSQVNLIKASVCPVEILRSLEPPDITVRGVVRNPLQLLGSFKLSFSLGSHVLQDIFYVVDDASFNIAHMHGILSRNFMALHKVFLRGNNDRVEHLGVSYPLYSYSNFLAIENKRVRFSESIENNEKLDNSEDIENSSPVYNSYSIFPYSVEGTTVRLRRKITVPSHSVFPIQIRVSAPNGEYIFHPGKIYIHGVSSVAALCTVKDGICNLAISNDNVTPERIPKGTCIGTILPLTEPQLDALFLHEDYLEAQEILSTFATEIGTENKSATEDDSHLPRLERILRRSPVDHIPQEYKQQFINLYDEFSDIMQLPGDKLSSANFPPFDLDTGDHPPIVSKPYTLPQQLREPARAEFQRLQDLGVIEPSSSNWSNPCFITNKKSAGKPGRIQLICDLRKLNAISAKPLWRFPSADDILQQAGSHKFYNVIDLSLAYFQCPVTPETSKKLSFVTDFGSYTFKRIPYGLSQAPFYFTRCLDTLLQNSGLSEWAFAFLDDILSACDTYEEGLSKLKQIFACFREANLKISPSKLRVMQTSVEYLGFSISAEGIRPVKDKVEVIVNYPRPTTVKQVKRFTGMLAFYSKHIPRFSEVLGPLFDLTKIKNTSFEWTADCEQSFKKAKDLLAQRTLLSFIDMDPLNPPLVYCDASNLSIGIALNQKQNGKIVPIAFNSRRFSSSQLNWHTYRKELEAVIWALKAFKNYLLYRPFILFSDHRPLSYIHSSKNLTPVLQRHLQFLLEFDFKIYHVKGVQNSVVDALSRILVDHENKTFANIPEGKVEKVSLSFEEFCENLPHNADQAAISLFSHTVSSSNQNSNVTPQSFFQQYPLTTYFPVEELKNAQCSDPRWKKIITKINNGTIFEKYYLDDNNLLIYNPSEDCHKICMPLTLLPTFLSKFHNSIRGHLGIRKTYLTLRSHIHSSRLLPEIKKLIKNCHTCNSYKPNLKPIVNPGQNPIGKHFFHTVHMDIGGPYYTVNTKYRYFLSLVCTFSKYIILLPLRNITSPYLINKFMKYVLPYFLTPKIIISDNAKDLISDAIQSFCLAFNIDNRSVSVACPSANGAVERTIQTVKTYIKTSIASQPNVPWHLHLPMAQIALNSSASTVTHLPPNQVVFGRHLRMPGEIYFPTTYAANFSDSIADARHWQRIWDSVHSRLSLQKQSQQRNSLLKIRRNLKIGDIVYIKDDNLRTATEKLEKPAFFGPYIVKIIKNNNVVLQHKENSEIALKHISKLKLVDSPKPKHSYNLRS